MKIVFFTHPPFLASQSMPRFAEMLFNGMLARGHNVQEWTARKVFFALPAPRACKKWLAYIDQFLVFPLTVKLRLLSQPEDTLYVFADQALGPWVPLVAKRPHVIHCHDFLAQRSARGEYPENPTSRSGMIYQSFIRWGYTKGQNFISVSEKTRRDLHEFLGRLPGFSEVVYNGLNQSFVPATDLGDARSSLGTKLGIDLAQGFLLHVGGNLWYKNRPGVLQLYQAWRKLPPASPLPLLMIGEPPSPEMLAVKESSDFNADIHFIQAADDATLRLAYQAASVFLFPSIEEGFGWPVAEAMASGCPVVTTDRPPMTEVAGNAATLISVSGSAESWTLAAARVVEQSFGLSSKEHEERITNGISNAQRFDAGFCLNEIERFYRVALGL
jgi:glycosyltransferase involved in cell wall biosynthesis